MRRAPSGASRSAPHVHDPAVLDQDRGVGQLDAGAHQNALGTDPEGLRIRRFLGRRGGEGKDEERPAR